MRAHNKCLPLAAGKAFPKPQALSPAAGFTGNTAGAAQQGNPGINRLPELTLLLPNLLKTNEDN